MNISYPYRNLPLFVRDHPTLPSGDLHREMLKTYPNYKRQLCYRHLQMWKERGWIEHDANRCWVLTTIGKLKIMELGDPKI